MPWDGTELWTAELAGDGTLSGERLVAGGPQESILQPLWSPAGELWFASDRTGWWNLYAVAVGRPPRGQRRRDGGATGLPEPCPLVTRDAEFVKVPWVFGLQHYVFLADGTLAVSFTEDGRDHLAVVDAATACARARPTRPRSSASSSRPTASSIRSPRSATASR